eukprot:6775055-Pyramimonas_sp.AAC.1
MRCGESGRGSQATPSPLARVGAVSWSPSYGAQPPTEVEAPSSWPSGAAASAPLLLTMQQPGGEHGASTPTEVPR